jgi:hypothetical protein
VLQSHDAGCLGRAREVDKGPIRGTDTRSEARASSYVHEGNVYEEANIPNFSIIILCIFAGLNSLAGRIFLSIIYIIIN